MVVGLVIVGIAGIAILAGIAVPVILRQQKKAAAVQALINAKQIGLALMSFDNEYGCFPNNDTAAKAPHKTGNPMILGTSTSNDYFRQLIAASYVDYEKIFYAKIPGIHKPDNVMTGTHCLEAGECAFTYVYGLSDKDNIAAPLLITPMIPGTTRFDPEPFAGKAVVLRLDQSATLEPIDSSGRVIVNSLDLFDPKQPFWHGKTPELRYPAYR